MQLVCRLCSRPNPPLAQFCWYDGVALDNAAANGVALPASTRPFPMPFVFPSGRGSRNFDELVLACETLWTEAQQLLESGFIGAFLGGLGRADLAMAASRAARHADKDQGLDDLLSRFPATTRTPPLLVVDPPVVNLGQLNRSSAHAFPVQIDNAGMSLLTGTLSCDNTPWLALGDAQGGSRQKLFQTRFKQTFSVHVNVKALPASDKPLEGRLVVESNGGTTVIRVQAAPLPVQAFAEGVLAGCRTPRQVAERARANPRDAAILFERGAVASWYASNGWVYPVQGPSSTGLAAVQQFFEALGLVKPPKVEISPMAVELSGAPGTYLTAMLLAHTVEKRAVWAHATTDAPWLEAGHALLDGRSARIPLVVRQVPAMSGSILEADVHVTANGNQRFMVRVRLTVSARAVSALPSGAGQRPHGSNGFVPAVPSEGEPWFLGARPAVPAAVHASVAPVAELMLAPASPVVQRNLAREDPSLARPTPMRQGPVPQRDSFSAPQAAFRPAGVPVARSEPIEAEAHSGGGSRLLTHLAPLAVLLLALFVAGLHDLLFVHAAARVEPGEKESAEEARRRDEAELRKTRDALAAAPVPIDRDPYLELTFHTRGSPLLNMRSLNAGTMRFGIKVIRKPTDPPRERGGNPELPLRPQRLIFHPEGVTNNTCVRIDNKDYLFGSNYDSRRGHWIEMAVPLANDRIGMRSVWEIDEAHVRVTQEVEVVASGVRTDERVRRLDTCLITWNIENLDTRAHKVGLRFLLDTFIGDNDGVPFLIPGKQLCSTSKVFVNEEVPAYLEAYENDSLTDPGTVARLTFHVSDRLEPPGKVILGGWPDPNLQRLNKGDCLGHDTLWNVPVTNIAELHDSKIKVRNESGKSITPPRDSAVTMYWGEDEIPAGGKRPPVGFAYGLGGVAAASRDSKMLLTLGRPYNRKFTATALVLNPTAGETLTLTLPQGLTSEEAATRTVPGVPPDSSRPISAVTWSLQAEASDHDRNFDVVVKSSRGFTERQTVTVRGTGKHSSADSGKGLFD